MLEEARRIRQLFHEQIDFLRNPYLFPDITVNSVMRVVWSFIGRQIIDQNRRIVTAIPFGVDDLSSMFSVKSAEGSLVGGGFYTSGFGRTN